LKVFHWITYKKGVVSGLLSFSLSLYLKMLQLGYDARLCSNKFPDGGEIDLGRAGRHRVYSWNDAIAGDAVNVIHTDIPKVINKLPNKVMPCHGSPLYVFYDDYLKRDGSLSVSAHLVDVCDLVICWNPDHIAYWSEFTDNPDKIKYVRGGIDVDRFTPVGEKVNFLHHPCIAYADAIRVGIKQPYTLLFAIKKVAREIPDVRLQLVGIPSERQGFWHYLIGRLKLDVHVENIFVGLHPNISAIYRGVDMLIHPVIGGSISSVGCEALACGCPVIVLEGRDDVVASLKCRDHPDDMAEAILKLWDRIQRDGDKVRKEARELAVKNYNICNTIEELITLFSNHFNLDRPYPSTTLAEKDCSNIYWRNTPRGFGYESRLRDMAKYCSGLTLDVGCGKAPYYHHLPESTVFLDLSKEALAPIKGDRVVGDALNLPFIEGVFDSVFASELLEHLSDDRRGLAEVDRVLKDGGKFVLSTPDGSRIEWKLPTWYSHSHKRLYTPSHLTQVLSIFFKIYKLEQKDYKIIAYTKK